MLAVDLKAWWWLPIVWGIANVLALVGVGVALAQLWSERSRRIRFLIRPVTGPDGPNVIEISAMNRLTSRRPLIRGLWTDEAERGHPLNERPIEFDPNVEMPPQTRIFLGSLALPEKPFVIIARSHDGDWFISRRRFRPKQLRGAGVKRFITDDALALRALRRIRRPSHWEVPSRAPHEGPRLTGLPEE